MSSLAMSTEAPRHRESIIEIRNAFKRYSPSNVILRGLNMTVARGTIYGLLGPSGCGKTTLLSCLSGRLGLDSGSVSVKLDSRKQLGYMPQDIALMELFTVSEMLHYFGRVNGLSAAEITNKGEELLQLMELPAHSYWHRVIATLSGGQQRRISLTVALIHDPLLLILDEPTVGLDPLINHRLWEFFVKITDENEKTLIITTHYIEEARHAHKIGLMRNGVLLAEESPQQLLTEYNSDSLEDVFLLLSQQQSVVCVENDEAYPKKTKTKGPFQAESLWDRGRMEAQIFKNICWVKRNIPVMVFILVLPAILMLLFCNVYSDTLSGVNIAVVSDEVIPDSCLVPRDPTVVPLRCKPQSRYSCRYVQLVRDKSYTIVEYQDFDSAFKAVAHGQAGAFLYFSKNYSWSLIRRLSEGIITPDRYVNSSMVSLYIDNAERTIGFKIMKDVKDSMNELIDVIFHECGYNPRFGQPVIKFENPVFGERSPKFTHTSVGGFVLPFAFYISSFFASASIHGDKITGFSERCLISGVREMEILFAHIVIQVLLAFGQNVMMLTITYGVYSLPMKGSWFLLNFFVAMVELQGMLFGICLATIMEEERTITYMSIGVVICLFLSCGMFWPIEGAHWIIYSQLKNFPIITAVESYRSVTVRGWGLAQTPVLMSVISNTGLALVLMLIYVISSNTRR